MTSASIQPPTGIVRDTGTPMGRGVFATRAIAADELIEACPVLRLTTPILELPEEIRRVVFQWEALAGEPGVLALALGHGSLYNHANPANARYAAAADGDSLIIHAARPIAAGEQITINYNAALGAPCSEADNWFADRGVELHVPAAAETPTG